ncbi:MAG TPA: translation initiation factor IF-3 [Acidimicrobiales bacterium]|nr:translation initiation factor IF-3 [Acidimicrobiales bacterium]
MATPPNNEPRINDRIRAREVRLVGPDGQQIGIKPLPEALSIARQNDLDLVEVAAQANPPVCRIMDYGKYKYEAAQKAKESRRKASNVSIKEMKYRPKISKGDFDTKTRKVERFLQEGHKVKVTLTFRGREMHHPELGRRILDQVVAAVEHLGKVEIFPRQDGRNMTMVLGPDRKAQAAAERARRQSASDSPEGRGESADNGQPAPAGAGDGAAGQAGGPTGEAGGAETDDDNTSGAAPAPAAPARAAAAEASEPVSQNQPGEG